LHVHHLSGLVMLCDCHLKGSGFLATHFMNVLWVCLSLRWFRD